MVLTTQEQLEKNLAIRKKELEKQEYNKKTTVLVDSLKDSEGFDVCMTELRRIETATNALIASRKSGLEALEAEIETSKIDLINADK